MRAGAEGREGKGMVHVRKRAEKASNKNRLNIYIYIYLFITWEGFKGKDTFLS